MGRFSIIVMAAVFSLKMLVPAFADDFTAAQKTQLEELIHNYLMDHPEIMRDMASKLDASDKLADETKRFTNLKSMASEIFHNPADAVVGNSKGDVTIVEFMDYNCGWCKKSVKEMQSLVGADKKVRVVMKEFPIFGAGSEYAARAALASVKQGKYWKFHQALFASENKITPEVTDQIATEQGLDVAKMKADMKDPAIDTAVQKNQALATALAFTGTPAFIVDSQVIPGYAPLDNLQATLASVRANGGCKIC